ncbi:MAG: hypothetical protein QM786_07830 [Breznakibacter sp.]
MMKFIALIFLILGGVCYGQDNAGRLEKVFRVNALSPGIELELPVSSKSIIAVNPGIGISGSYNNLSYTNSGVTYFVSPFLDLSYRKLYNLESRTAKGKNISGNSGNYWGMRLLTNFKEFESENVIRKDNMDFAFGPTWGIQRSSGCFHLLFDVGSVYYFDTKGNNGFFPVMLQLNIGWNLKRW